MIVMGAFRVRIQGKLEREGAETRLVAHTKISGLTICGVSWTPHTTSGPPVVIVGSNENILSSVVILRNLQHESEPSLLGADVIQLNLYEDQMGVRLCSFPPPPSVFV